MVQWQLHTLDHLNASGFGRPPPRHGLQLLFWFSNHCVTCEVENSVENMKLVTDCQPENGVYGFHRFGNMEELLPVLYKPKRQKNKRQLAYFVVGNLNPTSYPESADLPASVREYYGMDCSSNMDRIIISYQVNTSLVEKVYITEHDNDDIGRFRSDGTHEISPELIRALQNPQLDLSTFLTQMGYYGDVEALQDTEEMQKSDPSVSLMLSMMQNDPFGFFSEAFSHHVGLNPDPRGPDGSSSDSSVGHVVQCRNIKPKNKKPKSNKRQKTLRRTYWDPGWKLPYREDPVRFWSGSVEHTRLFSDLLSPDFDEEEKKKAGGGFSLLRLLLGVGAIYLGFKCFSWLTRSCWNQNNQSPVFWMVPGRTQSYPRAHIMLDYVY